MAYGFKGLWQILFKIIKAFFLSLTKIVSFLKLCRVLGLPGPMLFGYVLYQTLRLAWNTFKLGSAPRQDRQALQRMVQSAECTICTELPDLKSYTSSGAGPRPERSKQLILFSVALREALPHLEGE